MKINNLSYSQLRNALKDNKLLFDISNSPNEQLFRTQKTFSSRSQRTINKFDSKNRIYSSVGQKSNSKLKKKELQQQKLKKARPATGNPTSKAHKSLTQREQIVNRPRTATNRFYTGLQLKKSNKKQDIFLELCKQIKKYFSNVMSSQQKQQTLEQLKLILNILQKNSDPTTTLLHLQKLENQLSRFLKHRISHLFFYLVYQKFITSIGFNKQNSNNPLKILILCEYHSRTFLFRKIALLICMQIQQKYIKLNNYQLSRKYAIKCLKLSVVLNQKYYQVKMLEYLGVVQYYEGVLNLNGSNLLTEKQKINILKLYNEQQEIPKIFNFNNQNSNRYSHNNSQKNDQNSQNQNKLMMSFDKDQLYFNQGQNFVVNNIPTTNLKRFNRNFHGIAKNLRKTTTVKQSIKKVNEVGQVKKFIAKDNFITLYPQGNTLKNTYQNQVFLTHKKYGDLQKGNLFVKRQLPSIINKLQTLIFTQICERKRIEVQQQNK